MQNNQKKPPRPAKWIIRKVANPADRDQITGDYEEEYYDIAEKKGIAAANKFFWTLALVSIPSLIKNSFYWGFSMFRSYFKIGLRNIKRNRIFSAINIFGLSLGLASCIIIYLFVKDELSFDRFHEKADRIYSIVRKVQVHDFSDRGSTAGTGQSLENLFSEIEETVTTYNMRGITVKYRDNIFNEEPVFTNPEFLRVFSFKLLKGNPETVLKPLNSAVLTENTARKYFGEADPLGKTLTMLFGHTVKEFTVSGITENPPRNSTVRYDILLNIENMNIIGEPDFTSNMDRFNCNTYLLLKKETSTENIHAGFPDFIKRSYTKYFNRLLNAGLRDNNNVVFSFRLQNIRDMHLGSGNIYGAVKGNKGSSHVLSGIAFLILVIACINFINLSIGNSTARAVEIGIRKVMGAQKRQLIRQFWFEFIILTFFAAVTAFFIAAAILPVFNELASKNLRLSSLVTVGNISAIIFMILVVGIISGLFPSMVMSGFAPVEIFRKKIKLGGKNLFTRFLITMQFALSVFLIISTLIMGKQINFMVSKDTGINKEGVVVIELQERESARSLELFENFRNRLDGYSAIKHITGSAGSNNRSQWYSHINFHGEDIEVHYNRIHYDYLKTLGIKLAEGRDFSREHAADITAAIVNRKFVKTMNMTSPLGKTFRMGFYPELTIIGVVEDYIYESLKEEIMPGILTISTNRYGDPRLNYALVRIQPENITETIGYMEYNWKEIQPDKPFRYSFLDEDIENFYNNEKKWNLIVRYSSIFAIVITCLGIFGLTSITLARRTKEICVRKIHGSSTVGILVLISKEIMFLVGIANIFAWPAVLFFMRKWMNSFISRTNIDISSFLLAALITFVIAFTALSIQTIKTAMTNPVKSLRNE